MNRTRFEPQSCLASLDAVDQQTLERLPGLLIALGFRSESFAHGEGKRTLTTPEHAVDMALRLRAT